MFQTNYLSCGQSIGFCKSYFNLLKLSPPTSQAIAQRNFSAGKEGKVQEPNRHTMWGQTNINAKWKHKAWLILHGVRTCYLHIFCFKVNTYPYQLKYFSIRTKDFQSYMKKYTMCAIELMPTMRYNSFGKSSCHHGYWKTWHNSNGIFSLLHLAQAKGKCLNRERRQASGLTPVQVSGFGHGF